MFGIRYISCVHFKLWLDLNDTPSKQTLPSFFVWTQCSDQYDVRDFFCCHWSASTFKKVSTLKSAGKSHCVAAKGRAWFEVLYGQSAKKKKKGRAITPFTISAGTNMQCVYLLMPLDGTFEVMLEGKIIFFLKNFSHPHNTPFYFTPPFPSTGNGWARNRSLWQQHNTQAS